MDEILPIFPLGLVLLPGEPEQLRIFEPRYKQMLDDQKRADALQEETSRTTGVNESFFKSR